MTGRGRLTAFLATVATTTLAHAGVFPGGGTFNYEVFRATVSIPYVSLSNGALVNGRFTNRHFVNLAQGRDPNAAVPRNEILVVLNPNDYIYERNARFAVFDTTTKTVVTGFTQVDESVSGYGTKNDFFLFARGSLLQDLGGPGFVIGQTSLSGTALGREKETSKGTKLIAKTVSLLGTLPLVIGGVETPAVVLKGRVRVFGKPLASFPGP